MQTVGFHFVLLAAGEILKHERFVTAQKIQDFIQADDAFGVRLPLSDCRLALTLLNDSGFVMPSPGMDETYERSTLLMVYDKWK